MQSSHATQRSAQSSLTSRPSAGRPRLRPSAEDSFEAGATGKPCGRAPRPEAAAIALQPAHGLVAAHRNGAGCIVSQLRQLALALDLPPLAVVPALQLFNGLPLKMRSRVGPLLRRRVTGLASQEVFTMQRILRRLHQAGFGATVAHRDAARALFGPSFNELQRRLCGALLGGLDGHTRDQSARCLRVSVHAAVQHRDALLLYFVGLRRKTFTAMLGYLHEVARSTGMRADGWHAALVCLSQHTPEDAMRLAHAWSVLCGRFGATGDTSCLLDTLDLLPHGTTVAHRLVGLVRCHAPLTAEQVESLLTVMAGVACDGVLPAVLVTVLPWFAERGVLLMSQFVQLCARHEDAQVYLISQRLRSLSALLDYPGALADLLDGMARLPPTGHLAFLQVARTLYDARELGVGPASVPEVTLAVMLTHGDSGPALFTLDDAPGLNTTENVMNAQRIEATERSIRHLSERLGGNCDTASACAKVLCFLRTQYDAAWARRQRGGRSEYTHARSMLTGNRRSQDRSQPLCGVNQVRLPGGLTVDVANLLALIWEAIDVWPQHAPPDANTAADQANMRIGLCRALAQCIDEEFGGRVCATGVIQRLLRPLGGYYSEVESEDIIPEDLVYSLAGDLQKTLGDRPISRQELQEFRDRCLAMSDALFATAPHHQSRVPALICLAERCFDAPEAADSDQVVA